MQFKRHIALFLIIICLAISIQNFHVDSLSNGNTTEPIVRYNIAEKHGFPEATAPRFQYLTPQEVPPTQTTEEATSDTIAMVLASAMMVGALGAAMAYIHWRNNLDGFDPSTVKADSVVANLAIVAFFGIAAFSLGICIMADDAGAATFTVNSTLDTQDANPGDGIAEDASGNTTLRAAIMEANDLATDDIIILPAGTYTRTLSGNGNNGDLDIINSGTLTISGADAATTIIDADEIDRVFDVYNGADLTIEDVTVSNGKINSNGGGIYNAGTMTMTNSTISGSSVLRSSGYSDVRGGGIYNAGTMTVTNSTISGNSAKHNNHAKSYGGGIYNAGTMTVTNSAISGNSATSTSPMSGVGGGIFNEASTMTVTDSTISGNTAKWLCGGIYNKEGTITLTNSTISGNSSAEDYGGGIYNGNGSTMTVMNCTISGNSADFGGGIYNSEGTITVTDSTISGNSADYGGGIYNFEGTVTVTNSTISGNSVEDYGGGIYNPNGTMTVTDSTISGNSANNYGGIYNCYGSTMTVMNSTISGNSADGIAGGIYNYESTMTVTNSTISENSAHEGGGIYNVDSTFMAIIATVTVTNSTISENSAHEGGGIYNRDGTVTVTNSTISENSAARYGGGIYNDDSTITVTNSTISGNSADYGGGIYNPNGTMTVTDSTISGNSANNYGGGIINHSGALNLGNTIVAGNTGSSGPDGYNLGGTLSSQGYNLIGNNSNFSFTPATGDQVGTAGSPIDPLLDTLQDNGGPTQTHALLTGSPAIDAGDNTDAPIIDQRGAPRIWNGQIDIGSFEYGASVLAEPRDWGDAPESYLTAYPIAPLHVLGGGLYLGSSVDGDIDGQPTASADGDDNDLDGDDEDGVTFHATLLGAKGDTASLLRVTASGTGQLDAWIDFDRNGVFDHPSEHINGGTSLTVSTGSNLISFTVPSWTAAGSTFARFRLSSAGGLMPTGIAYDGEVEDHAVTIVDGTMSGDVQVDQFHTGGGAITIRIDGIDIVVKDQTTGVQMFRAPAAAVSKLTINGSAGDDTLIIEGMTSNDTFSVEATTGTVSLTNATLGGSPVNVSQADVEHLVLSGLAGDDLFVILGAHPYDSITFENFSAPVPDAPWLDPSDDTGSSNSDNVTSEDEARIFINADLAEFADAGIDILDSTEVAADEPGAAVEVSVNGIAVGIATPIPGTNNTLFEYTFEPGELSTTFIPVTGGGGLNVVKAMVRMYDGQGSQVHCRTEKSKPLLLTLDNTPPFMVVGDPSIADDGLCPESDSGVNGSPYTYVDRVTNDTTPTFFGFADPGTVILGYVVTDDNSTPLDPDDDTLVQIGTTITDPDMGTSGGTGEWRLSSTVDMNDPNKLASLPIDEVRHIRFIGRGFDGNLTDPQDLMIFIDTRGPRVTDVYIKSEPAFDLFGNHSNGATPPVSSLMISVEDLPFRSNMGPIFLYPALESYIAIWPGHYHLVGDDHGAIAITEVIVTNNPPIAGSPSTATIELRFAESLPDDFFTLTVSDSILDPVGNKLDGESNAIEPQETPIFPTGDGIAGGDYGARFIVNSILTPIDAPDLLESSDSGTVGDDNVTNKEQPALQGIGESFANVRVYAMNVATSVKQLIGEGVVGSDDSEVSIGGLNGQGGLDNDGLGLWEVTVEPLIDGVYEITAEYEDEDGVVGRTEVLLIEIDTLAPQRPTLDLVADDDTGSSNSDNVTGAANPLSFTVTAEAGSRVLIKDGETVIDDFVMPGSSTTTQSLTMADGTHLLSAEAFDAAGNRSHQSAELIVTIDRSGPVAKINGPYSGNEGSPISLSGSGSTGRGGSGIALYEWDLDFDGNYDDATGITTSITWNDDDIYSIGLKVTDDLGNTGTASTTVTVNNVAPTATFSNNGPKDEGTGVTYTFSSQTDPGTSDTFTYSFDWDNDGTYDIVDQTSPSAIHTWYDNRSYTVMGRISDNDGASNEYTTEVTMDNVAPTATISNNGPKDEGSVVTVTFSNQYDPGTSDTFTYSFDWDNDGTYDIVDQAGFSATHTWYDNGSYTVMGRIKDNDGDSSEYTTEVTVDNVAPTATFTNDGPKDEGSAVTVTFSNQYDPGTSDTFTYSFDWDNDGTYDIVD